jgi:hypothetical protein
MNRAEMNGPAGLGGAACGGSLSLAWSSPTVGNAWSVEGPPGVQSADVRPSEALNLAALTPAPILVAPEVLQEAEARRAGDSPTAAHACVERW